MLGTRRWRALVAAEAIGITLAFAVAPARAADEGAEAQADELIRQALDMRRSGDDQGARPLFLRAHDTFPSPRAAAQLGFCEQALGLWPDAEIHVSESLHAPHDPWVGKHRAAIDQAMVLIKAHIARVEIAGEPAGAEVSVNGNVVGHLPLEAPLRLSGGDTEFELRAPGFQTLTKRLDLRGGQYHRIVLRAEALPAATTTAPAVAALPAAVAPSTPASLAVPRARATDSAVSEGSGPLRRSLKFLAWGAAIGATAFAIYGFNDKRERIEEFNAGCGVDPTGAAVSKPDAPPGYSDQHCASLRNRFQWSSTAAWVGVASGVGLTVGGFVLWLTESEPSLRQTAAADCLRTLALGPTTLACTVRF